MNNSVEVVRLELIARRCTSLACQLYPYRPYRGKAKRGSKNTSEDANFGVESENSGKGDNHAG